MLFFMNAVSRAGSFLLLGFLLAPLNLAAYTVVLTNTTVRIMAANLNGNTQSYQPFATRIFQGLHPDVVAIQEFNYTSTNGIDVNNAAAFREMVDIAFGTNFVYFRENYTASGDLPNGIISRYPILASGSWADPYVGNRGFAWAQVALPGTNSLYVVSVHLLTSSAGARANEAAALKPLIQANFPSDAWIVLAGDFNTDTRSEAGMTTFGSFLSDIPVPADQQGNSYTSINRNHPHDYVLPSFSFTNLMTASVLPSSTFPNGLVFDSRVYTPLTDVPPVQSADSGLAQHMAVMKDFLIPYTITNSPTDVPSIVTQPQSQKQEPGNSATFTVIASGAPTLTYQWRFNGGAVNGATDSGYIRLNVQPPDAGSYSVVITNSFGSITSSVATLQVGTAPAITAQPQSLSVTNGATAAFSVTATGTLPLAYQWRFNSADISGATDSTYSRTNAQITDAGSYSVLVTNIAGSVTSVTATLTVNEPPSINSQPQSQTNFVGQNATFTVAATGAAPLSYQWRFNGADLGAATGTSYTRSNAQLTDAGSYSVVVTNDFGTRTSSTAVLTVNVQPITGVIAQWNFNDTTASLTAPPPSAGSGSSSLLVVTTPSWASGSTTDTATPNNAWNTAPYPAATTGNKTPGVQFNVSSVGKQNISIRWDQRASGTGSKYARLQYSTNGTAFYDFPTAVSVASSSFEAKTNDLSSLADVNNNPNFAFRIVTEFQSTATGSGSAAYVGATGTYATTGTLRFDMVTVSGGTIAPAIPPAITTQPQSQAANQGASASFSVVATSASPMTYQWRFNSGDLSGATASAYTRSNAQPADMGLYSVVLTNAAGTTTSSNATLSLVVPSPTLVMQSPQVIRWQGLSNLAYTIQARTNIDQSNWVNTGTASSPSANVSFTNQADAARRFYRVVYP
jgi:endonuclease/exonuclease/phosphatase family metal-dependent hydrolase